ncbi:DUF1841 family protein, partial [Neisseria sicca]|uniref:DUF1841 family protein n=1 Tax=Neisseria sicca TaxID=490 RepID=UPI0028FC32EE
MPHKPTIPYPHQVFTKIHLQTSPKPIPYIPHHTPPQPSLTPLQLHPLQQKPLPIIEPHPQYPPYLQNIQHYLHNTSTPQQPQTNPFLHISLHLSLQEQAPIHQPPPIPPIHAQLSPPYHGHCIRAQHR